MEPSVAIAAEKPCIFVSYARSDSSTLAEELVEIRLKIRDFEPGDRHDIAAAEDREARLGGLIQSADTVVFILSPAAVKSERCAWEVESAAELGKRVIPVEGKPVTEAETPERLRRLNYIFFTRASPSPGRFPSWRRRCGRTSSGSASTRAWERRPPAGRPGPGQAAGLLTTCCCAARNSPPPRPGRRGGRTARRRSRVC